MKKLFALVLCILFVFALASCGDDPCQHRDADDNSLCDKCGESYTDGKDIADSTPCQHRDADDNSLCDKCGESYTDGKDLPDEPACSHRDADDNSLCDKCGERYTDGKDIDDSTPCSHRDADDNSLCDKCGESYTDGKDVEGSTPCSHRDADDNSLCDECGESYTDGKDLPDEHTHDYTVKNTDSKYLATAADCENAATYFYSCSCGEKGTTTFTHGDANGHSYTVKSTDSKYLDKAADCDNAATYFYSCSCGAKGTTTFTHGSANGHSYTLKNTNSKYLDKAADCENAATYFYSCSCGEKGTTTFTHGNANGHSYVIQNVDPKYEKTPASEYTPAVYWKSCSCGKASTTETFTHGDMLPGYLTYQLSNDSSFYIVTGFVGAEENITIPHIYDSLPVFGVMANAFKINTTLKSISMPNSIQEIGSYAFAGCTSLESVSIPTSVKNVSPYTFSGCTSLKTITLHSGIEELGAFAFENCTALKSITLNEGLKTISNNAFDNCSSLEGITIPDSVTTLGNMAFRKATSLKYVNFSKALESIGNSTFQFCASLESVELHENITSLGNSTFSDCRGLKTLRILGNLESIGFSTFYDCRSLTSIYFASKTPGNCGNTNYIFYNAGIEGDGITLTIAKDAVVPDGFFTPYVEDNMPKITSIIFEEETTKVEYFKNAGTLPYLKNVTIPIGVTNISAKAFFGCADLTVNMVKDDRHYFGAWYDNASFGGNAAELNAYAGESEYLYAKWIPYSISIDKNIDVAGTVSGVGSYTENEKVTVTAQTNDGYTFLGWYENGTCVSKSATYSFNVNKATSLTAMWETNTYTITFDADGGTTPEMLTVTYNEGYTLPETVKTGYTFIGWFDGETKYEDATWYGLSDITLTAKWSANTYNLIYDDVEIEQDCSFYHYNADCSVSVTVVYDSEIALPTPTQPYHNFLGWYNGETKVESGEWNIAEDVTLVPKFEPISELKDFTFTYSDSGVQITGVVDKTKTSYVIPDCVTSIANGAFRGCSSVESMTLPFVGANKTATSASSSTLFGYIFGTSSYTGGVATEQYYISSSSSCKIYYIPSSLKCVTVTGGNILFGAFYNCDSLTSVVIPDSVTTIGSYAFYNCRSLTGITVDTNNQHYKDIDGNLYSKDGKILIQYAIGKTDTSFTIPDSVTSIGERAFHSCTSLTSVTIPDSVTSIGYSAFYYCTSLTSVTIPDSVTSIGEGAFYKCTSLASVTIPDSVTSIGSNAFYKCTSLTSVHITDIAKWCAIDFGSDYANPLCYAHNLYLNGELVTNLVIPDGVTSIGDYAFYNCTGLTSVTIPDSVTSIGSYAFSDCTSLTSIKYRGTQSQWNAISKGSNWDKYYPNGSYYRINYTITYNYEGE